MLIEIIWNLISYLRLHIFCFVFFVFLFFSILELQCLYAKFCFQVTECKRSGLVRI